MKKSIFPPESIQELISFVKTRPIQQFFDKNLGEPLTNQKPFDHIDHCAQAFLFGALPNAETLYFIARAFKQICLC